MNKTICILPGDGIGPEVSAEAVRVLKRVAKVFGHTFNLEYGLVGGAAVEKFVEPLPSSILKKAKRSDAVFFGAVGDPKYDNLTPCKRPEMAILKLRKELGLYANLRPVKVHSALADQSPIKKSILLGTDFVIVRELTGGIYFGESKRTILSKLKRQSVIKATDTSSYTTDEIKRVAKLAFKLAQQRRKKVTSIDKANVLETSRLWRETVSQVAKDYPDVIVEHHYVDHAAMKIIKKPTEFDVILTENMFGDILSDEAAVLSASIGLLPSASIGDKHPYLYEPIHGSAPKHAGKNRANPIGAILSAALMLRYSFGLEKEAEAVEEAVEKTLNDDTGTYDIASRSDKEVTTDQMGDIIVNKITNSHR